MNLFRKLFGNREKGASSSRQSDADLSFEQFARLSANQRISKVMSCGDTSDAKYYPLLKYCILSDPNIDVKFSALKRIHLFKDELDCKEMLTELENHINTTSLEPYYSMALSKTGIISLQEFERRINKA
jgi:hypothetical protein